VATGNYSFTVSGTGLVSGAQRSHSTTAALNVAASGQTALTGRVLASGDETPIPGATVSLDGKTSTTDAAGSFLLTGINAGTNRPVMIDGRTASVPNRSYPVITEPATVVASQANAMPFDFYLPNVDTQYEVTVVPGQTTVVTTPRVTGMSVTIPAGANLRNRDGSPVTRVSITPVPIDRTPTPLPPNVTATMVYTIQPGGAIADVAMPVVYPNLNGANPGTQMNLYKFNHDTVQWEIYGTGHVSADGKTVNPDTDPATGQQFGLRDFSWYDFTPQAPLSGDPGDPNGNPGDADGSGSPGSQDCGNTTPHPVDLASGVKLLSRTDIAFGGARGGLELTRFYTSDLGRMAVVGRFGLAVKDNYDIRITGAFQQGGAGRVVFPGEATGLLYSYSSTESDGTTLDFRCSARFGRLGDLLRRFADGTFEYRFSDGRLLHFNATGLLVAMIDRNGNTTTLTYSGSLLTTITDAVGRSISLSYAGSQVAQAIDPLGRVWSYEYDVLPPPFDPSFVQLLVAIDPTNHQETYGYDTRSELTIIKDQKGNTAEIIGYDGNGRVTREDFQLGGFVTYNYQLSGTVVTRVTMTDSLGRTVSRRFNASGYAVGTTDPSGQSGAIERDITTGAPTSTTGTCGCTESTRVFDGSGNPTSTTDRLGQTVRFTYDPVFGSITSTTDKLGHVTRLGYDSKGNLTSVVDALNQTATMAYDSFGELISSTDPLGHTTRMEYDQSGNLSATVDPLGNRTTMEYDPVGRVTAIVDPLGHRNASAYDALDQVISLTDPAGAVSTFQYDPNGNLTLATDALSHQTNALYDLRNRLVSITDAIGRTSAIHYDSESQLIALVSASGRTLSYGHDQRGLVTSITDPLGGVASFTYDSQGNLASLLDKRGFATSYAYDQLYRPTLRRDPLGQASLVAYDADGNRTDVADRLGRHVSFTYDVLNRTTNAAYADAALSYTYDAASRLTRLDDTQGGSIQWSYDDANRILSETAQLGAVSYVYDAAGDITSMTPAGRPTATYGYDSAGRVLTVSQGSDTFTYSYDILSRITGLQRPNGVTTSWSYDSVSRLTRLLHSGRQGQPLEDRRYSYDADDEITSIQSLASFPQLPPSSTASTADSGNRIAQFPPALFTFDGSGETTSRTDGQGTAHYQWDGRGRMVQASLPGGQTVGYKYDAIDRLIGTVASGVTTSFLYDGDAIVLDQASDGKTVDYLNGLAIDTKLRLQSGSGAPLYFLQDHLGSTEALLDSTANVVEQVHYDPFGKTAGSANTKFAFTGRELDQRTGLMYFRARWYDPSQGRFLSEDPIGYVGGVNVYAYALDNPLSFFDPSGLSIKTFFQGFKNGLITAGVSGLALAFAVGALGLSGGIPGAIILGLSVGLTAVYLLGAIDQLLHANLCPDERDRLIGEVLGSLIGGALGGAAGGKLGAAVRGVRAPAPAIQRNLRDIAVDPDPPQAKPPVGRTVGRNANQNAELARDIQDAYSRGATDVRVDQQQVNAQRERVGINRPDLQYTINGQRYYIEYDQNPANGLAHEQRILANDPTGIVIRKTIR
jgi:RHS repeat-associated protein